MKKATIWIVVAVAVVTMALLAFRPAAGGVKTVDAAGLIAAQSKGAQLIDVRSKGEYDLGHIAGAVNVPLDTLQVAAANWDRNATYVVYCASGVRSSQAVQIMTSMGFKNIDHFAKGVNEGWTAPLESSDGSSGSSTVQTSGKPVLIEFYTDS